MGSEQFDRGINISCSVFDQKRSNFGQILIRFFGKLGQIVSQVLKSLGQILIISTLHTLPKAINNIAADYN